MEREWNMVINWNKSDYMIIGKGNKKITISGIGEKKRELKYFGVILSKNIKRSAKKRLSTVIKERIKFFQRRLYFRLDRGSRTGIQWFETTNICFKAYSDWRLGFLSDTDIDNALAKILRFKTTMPKYANTEEVLTLIDIKPSSILKQISTKTTSKNKLRKNRWFSILSKIPSNMLIDTWKDRLWRCKEAGKIISKSEMRNNMQNE